MIFAIVLIGFLSVVQAADIILNQLGKNKSSRELDSLLADTLNQYGSPLDINLGDVFSRREDGSIILPDDPSLHQVATILEKTKQAVSFVDVFTYSFTLKSTFKATPYCIQAVTYSRKLLFLFCRYLKMSSLLVTLSKKFEASKMESTFIPTCMKFVESLQSCTTFSSTNS